MNRCRHVVSAQARLLAQQGWDVLLFDLLGTGDSSGDFGDATWDAWLEDIDDAVRWLAERTQGSIVLWGMRGGSLLATGWMTTRRVLHSMALWQPVVNGAQHAQHLVRMRLASGFLGKGGERESVAELRDRLVRDQRLEIAGYMFNAAVIHGLEGCAMTQVPAGTRLIWVEVASQPEPSIAPASQTCLAKLRDSGCEIQPAAVAGTAFWQIVERNECPALVETTSRFLERWR
jgi:exosortase A-associated hydrolase 2